jgi:hypothetical protein
VREIYERTDVGLRFPAAAQVEAEALGSLAGLSDALTGALSEEFSTLRERVRSDELRVRGDIEAYREEDGGLEDARSKIEELETAALAAATIDIAVAGDILEVSRDELEEIGAGAMAPAAVEEEAPSRDEREQLGDLLQRADDTFPEGMSQLEPIEGRALGAEIAERRVGEAVGELVGDAAPVAMKFGAGLLTLGVGHLLAALEGVSEMHHVANQLGGRAGCGIKLIDSGMRKIMSIVGVDPVTEALRHFELDESLEQLDESLRSHNVPIGERILRGAVRARRCEARAARLLQTPGAGIDNRHLDVKLGELSRDYGKNLRWARVIAKGIKWCAPGIVLLGPPGIAGLAGINGVGLVFVLFTLSDRLDTLPVIGHGRGVEAIVLQSLN